MASSARTWTSPPARSRPPAARPSRLALAALAVAGSVAVAVAVAVAPGPAAAAPGEAAVAEPVVVEARVSATPLAQTGRSVVVITREEIAAAPVRSVAELLASVAGVEVRTRGPGGVQADLSIRGTSFEQALVLVDGVRVSDPQTGHHLLDLPIPLDEIERIEVLRGQASSLYGPNAFGGVVNVITRRGGGASGSATVGAGSHGYREARAGVAAPTGPVRHRLAVEWRADDGHRHNTDAEATTASWTADAELPAGTATLALGWSDKDFGANGFYGERWPEQREATRTTLLRASFAYATADATVTPGVFWRRHGDDYVLDDTVTGPSRYENHTTTDVWGGRVEASVRSGLGSTAVAAEAAVEGMDGSRLGDRSRTRLGLSGEHLLHPLPAADLRAGLSAWRYSGGFGWEFAPGADLTVRLGRSAAWYLSAERAWRVPTYTELHYESPAQRGDPDLGPERAWTLETGARGSAGALQWSASIFRRDARDLIDWTRRSPEDPWRAGNVDEVATRGAEAGLAWAPAAGAAGPLTAARLDYAWLDSDRGAVAGESRYVLDHLRHQAVLRVDHRLPLGVAQRWWLRWERRLDGGEELLADAAAERRFGPWRAALEVTNLFAAPHERFPGVPLPGRELFLRVTRGFGGGAGGGR